ncbi:hypothetical protein FVW20_19085 [Desulfovibrio oxamicus]|uniref:Uncharacterized protein n=1 Tax=Nitratidesulfovibrio oxamicus TaxID=32016 RepID=A0ABS0J984_9BACT|nr:hypothetical protein [Nitratidesulfovibrio oxamicus]MBG3879040.1 hypothetical protein [Nitratidesulfovibrio oxamicus]
MKLAILTVLLLLFTLPSHAQPPQKIIIGKEISNQSYFSDYVSEKKSLQERINKNKQDQTSQEKRTEDPLEMSFITATCIQLLAMLGVNAASAAKTAAFVAFLSTLSIIIYILFIIRHNRSKWKLMTEKGSLRLLARKIKLNNMSILFFCLMTSCWASTAHANTNILQDLKMYYSNDAIEKRYVACKYSSKAVVMGMNTIENQEIYPVASNDFERKHNAIVILYHKSLKVDAGDFETLLEAAEEPAQFEKAAILLAKSAPDVIRDALATHYAALAPSGNQPDYDKLHASYTAMAARLSGAQKPLLDGTVRPMLPGIIEKVRNIRQFHTAYTIATNCAGAEENKDRIVGILARVSMRLDPLGSIQIARIAQVGGRETFRSRFEGVKSQLADIAHSAPLSREFSDLMTDVQSRPALLPVFEPEQLVNLLKQHNPADRMRIIALIDASVPSMGATALSSVTQTPKELAFLPADAWVSYVTVARKHTPGRIREILVAFARTLAEQTVPISPSDVDTILAAAQFDKAEFYDAYLNQEMAGTATSVSNPYIWQQALAQLPDDKARGYMELIKRKSQVAEQSLIALSGKDVSLLDQALTAFVNSDPKQLKNYEIPNTLLDLSAILPAFTDATVKDMHTISATIAFIAIETGKQAPDTRLIKRAMVPYLQQVFRDFLNSEGRKVEEEDVVAAVIFADLLARVPEKPFADEVFVLGNIARDYFSGKTANANDVLKARLGTQSPAATPTHSPLAATAFWLRTAGFFSIGASILLGIGLLLSVNHAITRLQPGENFSFLQFALTAMNNWTAFLMASLMLFPMAVPWRLAVQFCQAVSTIGTPRLSDAECLARNQELSN